MTLFNYMIRDFFKYVLGTIVLCIFLFVMFDFIHKTTKYFAVYKPETSDVIQFYLFQIPAQIVQGIPIASLLASVICMVLMSRTNEITAMRAAGMSPLHIGAPIAAGGMILSLLSIGIGEFIVPIASKQMRYVQDVLIEKKAPSELQDGTRWMRRDDNLYHFDDYDPLTRTMTNVNIVHMGLNFRPKQSIEAQYAKYQEQTGNWQLENIRVRHFNPNGTVAFSEERETQLAMIPIGPKKLTKERRKPSELGLFELSDLVDKGRASGIDVSSYEVDMHIKLAFHFAAFVVCLIGLKFGYRSERTVETARGILMAVGIGVSYWFLLSSGKAFGKRGTLPPFVAAWMANVIIFSIGAFEIWRTRKTSQ